MTTIAPGCCAFQARSWSAVIESDSEQPASRSGIRTFLSGREDRRGLGHEVHAAEDDRVGVRGGGLAGEPQRVAHDVRDVLHLGPLVVVGEDDGVARGGERTDLALHRRRCPRSRAARPRACLRLEGRKWLHRWRVASGRFDGHREVKRRRRMGQRTRVTPIVRQCPRRSWSVCGGDAARGLELRAPAPTSAAASRSCARVHVVEQQALAPRPRAPSRRPRASRTRPPRPCPAGAARARGASPPRSRPRARCGCPSRGSRRRGPCGGCDRRRPPRPASRAPRSPGVVLRVSSTFTPVPRSSCTQRRRRGRDAGQVAEEVQRHPLAVSSARASPSSVEHRRRRLVSHSPSGAPALDPHQRVQAAEHRLRDVEAEHHARRLLVDPRAGPRARARRRPRSSRRRRRRPRPARARSGPRRRGVEHRPYRTGAA